MDEKGQVFIEFNLSLILILIPLMFGGVLWFTSELNRSRCAYQGFFLARRMLIQSQQTVRHLQVCGKIREPIELFALEDLDHKKSPLELDEILKQASQLWEDALPFYRQSQDLGSIKSSKEPKI